MGNGEMKVRWGATFILAADTDKGRLGFDVSSGIRRQRAYFEASPIIALRFTGSRICFLEDTVSSSVDRFCTFDASASSCAGNNELLGPPVVVVSKYMQCIQIEYIP